MSRALTATLLGLLGLLACAACDRAEPDAAFRELTEPFAELSRDCWPFAGEPPFTSPWFADSFSVAAPDATLTVEVFGTTSDQVTSELATIPGAVVTPAEGEGPVRATLTSKLDIDAMTGCSS